MSCYRAETLLEVSLGPSRASRHMVGPPKFNAAVSHPTDIRQSTGYDDIVGEQEDQAQRRIVREAATSLNQADTGPIGVLHCGGFS